MEIDEIRESRRIRKWKEGFGEETETSRGWLSHRLFKPLGVSVSSSRAQATQKLRMMIRTPDLVSDNPGSDSVVRPSGFAIHALTDSILTKEILVLTARKLTPLIGIDYRRYSIPSDSFFYRVKNRSCVKRVR